MYEGRNNGILKNWKFLLSDIVGLELSLILSIIVRNVNKTEYITSRDIRFYVGYFICIIILVSLIGFFTQTYNYIFSRGYYKEFISSLHMAREYIEDSIILDGDQLINNPSVLFNGINGSGYCS